jgi:hypothetical protein
MIDFINEDYNKYLNKHSKEFHSMIPNSIEVPFSGENNIMNKYVKGNVDYGTFYKFCVPNILHKRNLEDDMIRNRKGWEKLSTTDIFKNQYMKENTKIFGVVPDFILGAFIYSYLLSIYRKNGRDRKHTIWPLMGIAMNTKKSYVVDMNLVYNDIGFTNLLPVESGKLATILSTMEPYKQIEFVESFYRTNFNGLLSYSVNKWAREKKYLNDGYKG